MSTSSAPTAEDRAAYLRAQMQADARREARQREEAKARAALARTVTQVARKVEESVDQELARLERVENMGDDELERLREKRLAALKGQKERAEKLRAQGHGALVHVVDDKDFFARAKRASKMAVHFARASTRRCEILQRHLELLAVRHLETLFVQVDAEKCPFIAERLKIHTLPSLVLCVDGKTEHTMIGFDDLGGMDDFATADLERLLFARGVCEFGPGSSRAPAPSAAQSGVRAGHVDFDDWQD